MKLRVYFMEFEGTSSLSFFYFAPVMLKYCANLNDTGLLKFCDAVGLSKNVQLPCF